MRVCRWKRRARECAVNVSDEVLRHDAARAAWGERAAARRLPVLGAPIYSCARNGRPTLAPTPCSAGSACVRGPPPQPRTHAHAMQDHGPVTSCRARGGLVPDTAARHAWARPCRGHVKRAAGMRRWLVERDGFAPLFACAVMGSATQGRRRSGCEAARLGGGRTGRPPTGDATGKSRSGPVAAQWVGCRGARGGPGPRLAP